jgi:hypothetical protein
MQNEFGYTCENGRYRCVTTRRDVPWGHGLKVEIFDEDGKPVNTVCFSCHPEFPEHEILQAMTTESNWLTSRLANCGRTRSCRSY